MLEAGSFLYHAGERAHHLYVVRVGSFKSVRVRRSGEEHIVGIHLPGDIFGLESMQSDVHTLDAIALETAGVCSIPVETIDAVMAEFPGIGRQLGSMVGKQFSELYTHQMLMQCFGARERLALFLLRYSERLESSGRSGEAFDIVLARRDLANYLGLQIETVSRIFSALRNDGIIDVDGKLVAIRDLQQLRLAAGMEPEENVGLRNG